MRSVKASLASMLISATLPLIAAADSNVDGDFVGKVSQGGAYEVLASKLALQRATAQDVRDLASAEVHDHELVNANLKKLADAAGIPIAPKLDAEFQKRLATLQGTPAPQFDLAYIEDMKQIHDKDEKLFAQEATDGGGAFKSFAHQTDLIVKRHIGALHGTD